MRKKVNDGMIEVNFKPLLSVKIDCVSSCVKFLRKIWDKEMFNILEQVYVLYLNKDNRLLCHKCLCTGSSNAFIVDIKLLLAIALGCFASKIIIAHNHPTGNFSPSKEDYNLTERLNYIVKFLDITLVDHVILSTKNYHSFKEHGELK